MSSIIVLDSSDEETDSSNKKTRIGPPARSNQVQATQSMARVNPLKGSIPPAGPKKLVAPSPSENIRIHLPSKRPTPNESSSVDQVPKKRIKPTTVVHSSDEEWINRQKNGEQPRINPPSAMLNKIMVSAAKTPVSVVKSPILLGSTSRNLQNSTRVVANPAAAVQQNSAKNSSQNYVRVALNGKDPKPGSPPVISKNIICMKEQSKASVSPPIINKNITATVKDQTKSVPMSPPTFKNSVTIRRVVVNDDRTKTSPLCKTASNTIVKVDQTTKTSLATVNATSIRRVTMAVDPLKTPIPSAVSNKHLNNSALKITPITSTSATLNTSSTSIRRIPANADCVKVTQSLPVLKRNSNAVKTTLSNATTAVVSSISSGSSSVVYSPATIKRIVTVDLPKTPASPPVITKNYSTVPNKPGNELPKTSMSMTMSVITKNNAKTSESKMSPPVLPKSLSMPTRPSGLIVTPITCAAATSTASTLSSKVSRPDPNPTRPAAKQTKPPINRPRPSPISTDPSLASMPASMFNMFPSMGGFMGSSSMMYGVDPSSGTFVNPAFQGNRPLNSLESVLPSMSPSVYNMTYPSFSGGSITPIKSPGAAPSPTYSTGRSSKSPVTSTVTRSSSNARSPAALMGIPIDVDQPLPPMSPPVYNMNHPPFNGDPFSGLRGTQNIPSPAYSPVRSTKSPISSASLNKVGSSNPSNESGQKNTTSSSPVFYRDLDNFVKNPLSYPSNIATGTATTGNGPVFSVDSPVRNHTSAYSPTGFFKSPTSTITSPTHSTISDGSSVSEVLPTNGDVSNPKSADDKAKELAKDGKPENADSNSNKEDEVKEPLNEEYKKLLDVCREADSSEDMNKLIESKLIRYYYSVHPDFVKSRGFRKAVVAATESIKKNPDLVYYHLRPVVEEMKARKKSKTIIVTNDESSEAAASETPVKDQGIEDKVRNRQIRKLSKGLYILTRKIHKLENEDVDLDDENSSYLIVERYKKRACEIYDKICDLTGESKHALRQVKKPITFKATDYPKFNKVVETFVNRTKEFPDFLDVLKMLEFCNDRYKFNLHKEEMTMIAQDAFIKIGKLLQSRRKADLYETVSHFTSDYEDPAANDPTLLAKLSENDKNQTSIGSIIDKYAREQVRRKAESANASGDDGNNISESCDTDGQSHDEEDQPNENNNCVKKDEREESEKPTETTNGKHTPPQSPQIISSASPSPSASTSAPFRISPPHAFASPQASPRPRSSSPLLPPPPTPSQALPAPATATATVTTTTTTTTIATATSGSEQQTQTWATNLLKILSVTSLNDSATGSEIVMNRPTVPIVDEIIISDEDL